jgi:hypothetical protein
MRHLMASITIAASALLVSGGTALADDPHSGYPTLNLLPSSGLPATGGTNGQNASCQTLAAVTMTSVVPNGQTHNTGNSSPYNNGSKAYSPKSEYDVSCLQQYQHSLK